MMPRLLLGARIQEGGGGEEGRRGGRGEGGEGRRTGSANFVV